MDYIDGVRELRDSYEDTVDVGPLALSNYTWDGFSSLRDDGQAIAILWAEEGFNIFQATVYLEEDAKTISLDDADVRAIIASISHK